MNKFIIILILLLTIMNVCCSKSQNKIFVFFGSYACNDCNKTIKIHIDSLILTKKIDSAYTIARTRNQILSKKLLKRDIFRLFPNYSIKYEFIEEDDPWPPKGLKGGLFGKYNVSLTPAVLFIMGNKEIFISYEKLYKYDFNLSKVYESMKIGK